MCQFDTKPLGDSKLITFQRQVSTFKRDTLKYSVYSNEHQIGLLERDINLKWRFWANDRSPKPTITFNTKYLVEAKKQTTRYFSS